MSEKRLGAGFIGSCFNAKSHMLGWTGVRDADVLGVWSPNTKNASAAARYANDLDVGKAKPYKSIGDMVADPAIDAIWLTGPNQARIENVEEIVDALERGRGTLKGIACEKPLARNVAEAKQVKKLIDRVGLMHGYLENQVFAPQVDTGRNLIWAGGAATTGRPYLARAAEEHSGPHMPWFWQGRRQGGGVLSDMNCHSVEVGRFLLTKPGAPLSDLKLVSASVTFGNLKWTRPEYVKRLKDMMGPEVDYASRPAEDFARGALTFLDPDGNEVMVEATNSWAYVGAGLRIPIELAR